MAGSTKPNKDRSTVAGVKQSNNKTAQAAAPAPKTSAGQGGWKPSSDYGSIAAQRVNTAAQGQFNDNMKARARAINEFLAATGQLGRQKDASISGARANNAEMQARLNNTMASRGINRGEGAALNMANLNAKAEGVIGGIEANYADQYGKMVQSRDARITDLNDADAALRAALPTKIQELQSALENQDFERWRGLRAIAMQEAGLALQRDQLAQSEELAYAGINAQKDAWKEQKAYEDALRKQDRADEIRAQVFSAAQKGANWTGLKNLVHALGGNDPILGNIDSYKTMLQGTNAWAGLTGPFTGLSQHTDRWGVPLYSSPSYGANYNNPYWANSYNSFFPR